MDVGARRWGLAISDDGGTIAFPRETVAAADAVERIAALVEAEGVGEVVVGLPKTLRGEAGRQALRVEREAAVLEARLGRPVVRFDERFTTAEAERAMIEGGARRSERRGARDAVAAALLLRTYLARRGPA